MFPFGDNAKGINATGFKYPLNNAELKMDFPLGVSNQLISDTGVIEVGNGFLIVMMVKE